MSMGVWDHAQAIMDIYRDPRHSVKQALEVFIEELRAPCNWVDTWCADPDCDKVSCYRVGSEELASKLQGLLDNFGYWR